MIRIEIGPDTASGHQANSDAADARPALAFSLHSEFVPQLLYLYRSVGMHLPGPSFLTRHPLPGWDQRADSLGGGSWLSCSARGGCCFALSGLSSTSPCLEGKIRFSPMPLPTPPFSWNSLPDILSQAHLLVFQDSAQFRCHLLHKASPVP